LFTDARRRNRGKEAKWNLGETGRETDILYSDLLECLSAMNEEERRWEE
jgi:hypothetical protein